MNLKTTLAGAIAGIAQFVGNYFPKYKGIADAVSQLATVLLGYFAADAAKKSA